MEVLFEIIGEILFEIVLTGIIIVISILFRKVNSKKFLKRNLELALTYIFIGLLSNLIISSIAKSETVLTAISLSYLLLHIAFSVLDIINHGHNKSHILVGVKILKTICHYTFPILLIIYGLTHTVDQNAINILLVFSSILLMILLIVDINRIIRFYNKPKNIVSTYKRENLLSDETKYIFL